MKREQGRSKLNVFLNAWVDFWKAGVSLCLPEKRNQPPIPGIDIPIRVERPPIGPASKQPRGGVQNRNE
jgi:hypothetical protein